MSAGGGVVVVVVVVDSNLQALRDTKGSVTTLAMETKLVFPPVLRSKLESDGPIGKWALQLQTSFQALDQAVSYLAEVLFGITFHS